MFFLILFFFFFIVFFSFFFSCLLILILFLFGFFVICFSIVLKILDKFLHVSVPGILFFSSDFLVLENEDLWVSANFFYFDNKIVESEQLAIPLKSNEFQVFYTLLHLFHKFPQPIFDKSYTSFAKNFTQNILGNNSTLYNVENKILEPYAKATMRANEYSALDGVKDFFSIFKNP